MVDEANLKIERIEALREYIRLLEKVQKQVWAVRLSPAERIVLDALERQVSWLVQIAAVLAGILVFGICVWIGRFLARSPILLAGVFVTAALLGLLVAVLLYRAARMRIARQEMRIAELEIYRIEENMSRQLFVWFVGGEPPTNHTKKSVSGSVIRKRFFF